MAGGFIASIAAFAAGQRTLADIMLGLGFICWLVLGSRTLNRLFISPPLPAQLVPTLAIEVAPPHWPCSRSSPAAAAGSTSG